MQEQDRLPRWQEWALAFAVYGAMWALCKLAYTSAGVTDFSFSF